MIEELLPCNVSSVSARGDNPAAFLFPEEAALIRDATINRWREFATARCCARRALNALGLPPAPILRGRNREPLWPPGIVGSITHCTGYRAAAVARRAAVVTIGIDAEPDAPLPPDVLMQVSLPEERAWLMEAPAGSHWDRLLFSAKESIYKAWFPFTGRWLGFEEAVVRFDPCNGTFLARISADAPPALERALAGTAGRFLARNSLVLTAVTVPR